MSRPDTGPLEPEMATALLVIDATLAGEPVDPEYAELAELALILRADRPAASDAFGVSMDERVAKRFARPSRPSGSWRRRLYGPVAAVAAAAAGAAVVVVLVSGSGGGSSSLSSESAAASAVATSSASSSAAAAPPRRASAGSSAQDLSAIPVPAKRSPSAPGVQAASNGAASGVASGAGASSSSAPSTIAGPAPGPSSPGNRQVVQSAQLQLSAAPRQIDGVAQQVFDVMGAEKGFVNSSTVTATGSPSGYATFQLSVPSANLAVTMTDLSRLRGAHVVSRTDTTADITGQVGGAGERVAEARALRRSLLRQLASATTTAQVDSLKAQLHDANASIASDLSTLRGLQRQVAYSKIALTINASSAPPPIPATNHSFTLGRAAHDAGRVLVVVAGVALIALAVAIPVGVVAALAAWLGLAVRRRRREHALDLV
jgi:Domain of unknown function (DUF4349)